MKNLWHDLDPGTPEKFKVIIEIPMNSRVKYELDKETGMIKFDRVLSSPMHYPANYGFVPKTLWYDKDPIDVLVLGHEPLVPGCLIEVRPIGILSMNDSGEEDSKIIAVPSSDPRFSGTNDIKDLESHSLEEISRFFATYKKLQNKKVCVGAWGGKGEAVKAVKESFKLYGETR